MKARAMIAAGLAAVMLGSSGCTTVALHQHKIAQAKDEALDSMAAGRGMTTRAGVRLTSITNWDLMRDDPLMYAGAITLDLVQGYALYLAWRQTRQHGGDEGDDTTVNNYWPAPVEEAAPAEEASRE